MCMIMIVGYNMFLITMPTLQQASGPLHNVSACLDAAFGTDGTCTCEALLFNVTFAMKCDRL